MYSFVYPKKDKKQSRSYFFVKLTNGNAAILNGQIDLNIPGGT
jgi:hypothetical protein